MSCRTGMLVTVTRPPGSRRMPPPRSADLFCLMLATSKACGVGSCAAATKARPPARQMPSISRRMDASLLEIELFDDVGCDVEGGIKPGNLFLVHIEDDLQPLCLCDCRQRRLEPDHERILRIA